jgi:hypothetical protein
MAQFFHLSGQALRDTAGNPYTSAKAYFYETGTTTPKNTYSDVGLTSANANPVIADGTTGAFPDIYLLAGRYKVVLQQSDGTSIDTWDPIDATLQLIASASAPGSPYPFMRYHNTTDGKVYRRNSANSAWIDEGPVDGIGNAASVTDILTGTSTSVLGTPDAIAGLWQRGTDLTSATTLSLPGSGGGVYNVTGTTTITGISTASGGRSVKLRFAASLQLTHNGTSFILPGAANITTATGDMAEFINDAAQDATGSNWRCFNYERASGSPLNITDQLGTQAEAETGTSATKTLSIANMVFHDAMLKYWTAITVSGGTPTTNDSFNHASTTDNGLGDFTLNFTTAFSAAAYAPMAWCRSATAAALHCINADPGDTQSTTALQIQIRRATDAALDPESIGVGIAGDR